MDNPEILVQDSNVPTLVTASGIDNVPVKDCDLKFPVCVTVYVVPFLVNTQGILEAAKELSLTAVSFTLVPLTMEYVHVRPSISTVSATAELAIQSPSSKVKSERSGRLPTLNFSLSTLNLQELPPP